MSERVKLDLESSTGNSCRTLVAGTHCGNLFGGGDAYLALAEHLPDDRPPQYSLEEGLKETVVWYKTYISAKS